MLLLSRGGGSGSGLDLGMLLGHQRRVLLLRVVLRLVVLLLLLLLVLQPGRISLRVLVLVGKNVLGLRLEHDGPAKNRRSMMGLVILRRGGRDNLARPGREGAKVMNELRKWWLIVRGKLMSHS
jgi:hypothetical protein